jgi:hypothetical protein
MKAIKPLSRALTTAASALLLALGAAACGTSDDPLADLPGPPETRTTATGPAGAQGAAGAGKGKGGRGDAGDDDDDDSPKGGDGSDGGDGDGGGGSGGSGDGGGGDDDDDSGSGDDRPTGPRPSGVTSTRTISSSSGEELTFNVIGLVAPPSKLTLTMRNRSSIEHGIAIAGDNVKTESDPVGPGETARVTFELPAGEYEFYCPVEGHQEMGMSGILSVGRTAPAP